MSMGRGWGGDVGAGRVGSGWADGVGRGGGGCIRVIGISERLDSSSRSLFSHPLGFLVSYPLPITITPALPPPWPRPSFEPIVTLIHFIFNADHHLFVSIHSQPPLRARCSPEPDL